MSYTVESMPYTIRFFPPSGENPVWIFELISERVLIDTYRFPSPMNLARWNELNLQTLQKVSGVAGHEKEKVFSLAMLVRKQLHLLRERGLEIGVDKDISDAVRREEESQRSAWSTKLLKIRPQSLQ
jgi:hypothetical protein